MKIDRQFPTIFSKRILTTKQFLEAIFELEVEYESDWFIHLKSSHTKTLEVGILSLDSKVAPKYATSGSFFMLTVVVKDVDLLFKKIKKLKFKIEQPPKNLFYGQRRMLVKDMYSNLLLDISSPCKPSKSFLASFKNV
jgi:uncharacterized glyoxalase superfamily protein PhnB